VIAEMTDESLCAGRRVSLRFQVFEADLEISGFDEFFVNQTNSNLLR
jgi:hypothetical protein